MSSHSSSKSSGRGKNKVARRNSDSAAASSTAKNGYRFFDENCRSILQHPVGLPLVAAFDGQDLSNLPSEYPVEAFPPEILTDVNGKSNTILSEVVGSLTKDSAKIQETNFTKELCQNINLVFSHQFTVETESRLLVQDGGKCQGRLDLAFLPKSKEGQSADTPLCVVEVGLSSRDWWKKFDQGKSYLELMQEKRQVPYCFAEPMLLVIITLDDSSSPEFDFRMGVFLCTPRNEATDFRMSLIWRKRFTVMEEASKSFGLLLRIMDDFQTQRSKEYEGESEYFSSNCVKAGDKVLRVFDTRFRRSERRSDLYLDPNCKGIVGGEVKKVLEIPEPVAAAADTAANQGGDPHGRDNFFEDLPGKSLLVIAVPFRAGQHVAQHPTDFLPIIEHLESIHEAGYVHGDIRAFNTALPEKKGGPGYLIDFDFSGKADEVKYPAGYVTNLLDGLRAGFGRKPIKKWHDWYALGRLIFDVHKIVPPTGVNFTPEYLLCKEYWMDVEVCPSVDDIEELKDLLSDVDKKEWKVEATKKFRAWLNDSATKDLKTKQGATGSPFRAIPVKTGMPP